MICGASTLPVGNGHGKAEVAQPLVVNPRHYPAGRRACMGLKVSQRRPIFLAAAAAQAVGPMQTVTSGSSAGVASTRLARIAISTTCGASTCRSNNGPGEGGAVRWANLRGNQACTEL